ncbi:MAG: precorrin-8X methylmutase [Oscillospiraceae bacterium]|nr:precorrin-8X methylmutase [Oscillospiraceae bacterium]
MAEVRLPGEIERRSMEIIAQELAERGIVLSPEVQSVVHRVIHATADFDYASSLVFTEDAVRFAVEALQKGTPIITDTNMAKAGISAAALGKVGAEAYCFMAEPFIADQARKAGTTRAVAAMEYAAEHYPGAVLAIGNAPTALFQICEQIENGLRPALVIGIPVGFVNVVESKEQILAVCREAKVPAIVARGRKGGSSVAVAICNALLYTASGLLDPSARGWN